MRLQHIIQQALEHNDWNIAIALLENAVLQGMRIDETLLDPIPQAFLMESPLIQKVLSERLSERGQLADARELMLEVTKKFAEIGLKGQLLSSLSMLAVVNVRMGLIHDAETVVRFLFNEWEYMNKYHVLGRHDGYWREAEGDVAYAIARGYFLLEDVKLDYRQFYRFAIHAYDMEDRSQLGSAVLFELIVQEHQALAAADWEERLAEFSIRVRRKQAESCQLDYLTALRWYTEGKLEQAQQALQECSAMSAPYHVQLALLRCKIAIERADQQESVAFFQQLEQYELDAASDLEWQFEYIEVKFQYALLFSNWQEAEILVSQAKGLLSHGLSQSYRRRIEAMSYKLNHQEEKTMPRIKLFGTFQFIDEHRAAQKLQWKRKKTKELLIFLLLQPDYTAAKEQIAEALFSDFEPKKMANQLYVAAHQLKTVLKDYFGIEGAVIIKDSIVKLRDDWFDEVDVEKYETLIRVGNQLWLDDRELAARLYDQALELYSEVAADLPYAEWLLSYRDKLAATQVELLRRLSKMALETKQFEQAELYFRQWCSWMPSDEEALQGLLQLLITQGKQTEAENLYRKFEDKLYDELGIAPLHETRAILWRD